MKESKSELYIVAIVGIVAIVAILIILTGGSKAKVINANPQNAAGAAGEVVRSYDLGACEYDDGSSSGCPCYDPSDGILSSGAKLIATTCKTS